MWVLVRPGWAWVKTMTVFRTVVTRLRNPKMVSVTRPEDELAPLSPPPVATTEKLSFYCSSLVGETKVLTLDMAALPTKLLQFYTLLDQNRTKKHVTCSGLIADVFSLWLARTRWRNVDNCSRLAVIMVWMWRYKTYLTVWDWALTLKYKPQNTKETMCFQKGEIFYKIHCSRPPHKGPLMQMLRCGLYIFLDRGGRLVRTHRLGRSAVQRGWYNPAVTCSARGTPSNCEMN